MLLELKDICKDFPQGNDVLHVLKNISLSAEEGEYISIMGRSGSGKSTLMNIIGCLDVPTSGRYLLDGEDIAGVSDNRLADIRNQTIGFVFQSFNLLPKMTVCENVALPLLYAGVPKAKRLERAKEYLDRVGLASKFTVYPDKLSGGEKQRVAIARAMMNSPRLLLADEPTGALDVANGEQIMDLFDELNAGGTAIVLITHEPSVGARARVRYRMQDGQLVSEGGADHA